MRCDIPGYYMQLCEKAERLICMKSMEVVNVLLLTELGFYREKNDVKQCDIRLPYRKCLWKKSIVSSEVNITSLSGFGGIT